MPCAVLGIVTAVIMRQILAVAGINDWRELHEIGRTSRHQWCC
jgi:hypothetical protein